MMDFNTKVRKLEGTKPDFVKSKNITDDAIGAWQDKTAADMKKRGAKHIAHHIEAGEAGDLAVCRGWKKLP